MRWEDEGFVKVYRRDTPEWLMLSWEARALFLELIKHCDRAGLLELGKHGARALAVLLRIPVDVAQRVLDEWLEDGCVVQLENGMLFVPNYRPAQEAAQTDAARKRTQREKAAADARAESLGLPVTKCDGESQSGTKCPARVTAGHVESHSRIDETRREEDTRTSADADALAPAEPEALQKLWNAEAAPELPRCGELPKKRRAAALRALREHPDLGFWAQVIQRANAAPFCRGEGNRGWRFGFDDLLSSDKRARLLEGAYDRGRGPSPPKPAALAVGRSEAPQPEARPWDGYHPRDDVGRHLLEQAAANGDVEARQKLEAWEGECADRGVDPWEHCDLRNPVDRQDLAWAVARGSSSAAAAMRRAAGGDA